MRSEAESVTHRVTEAIEAFARGAIVVMTKGRHDRQGGQVGGGTTWPFNR